MPVQDTFAAYCAELLSAVGSVRVKRMFGGHGLYVDDLFIALVAGETLYLKADEQTRPRFEAAGCHAFAYSAKGQEKTMRYWSAPTDAMDSPALMRPWAQLAIQAALQAKPKPKAKPG